MSQGKFAAERRLNHKRAAILRDLAVLVLFFAGLALIAAGLWHMFPPAAMIFSGLALLYLAGCVNLAAKHAERTVKK